MLKSKKIQNSQAPASVTPEYVIKLNSPSEHFLCEFNSDHLVQFIEFRIRDMASGQHLFNVKRPTASFVEKQDYTPSDVDRIVDYKFSRDFFKLKEIGTELTFAVGPKELNKFRMIERHYHKNKLLKSFDFDFGFCMPNSVNTIESVYELPKLDDKTIQEMIENPKSTTSDSFYFVDNKLIMHNKATYTYL